MNAQTERLEFAGAAGRIQALRDAPEGTPRGVAVIAHPHPLFGGTMDNKVVQTLARAFVQCGWTAVRFNFRGVGTSEGAHDEGRGEAADFQQVVQAADVAPCRRVLPGPVTADDQVAHDASASVEGAQKSDVSAR